MTIVETPSIDFDEWYREYGTDVAEGSGILDSIDDSGEEITDESVYRAVASQFRHHYDNVLARMGATLFRGMTVDHGAVEDILVGKGKVGVHWSLDADIARRFASEGDKAISIILQGHADASSVDVPRSIYLSFINYEDEDEIRLRPNSPMTITKVSIVGGESVDVDVTNTTGPALYGSPYAIDESRLDELSRPDTKEAEAILTDHGYQRVGSGTYAVVWGKPDSKTVLKLVKNEDKAYMDFVKLALKHQDNPHFPRFSSKVIRLNDNYKAIRMERLVAGKGAEDNFRSMNAYIIERYISIKGNLSGVADYVREDINKLFDQYPQMKAACDLIIANLSYHQNDLHPGNVMFRGNTMVITDPVSIKL